MINDNIFADIKPRSLIKEYEQTFFEATGIEYRTFLEQKFIYDGYSKPEIASMLGLKVSKVVSQLSNYDILKSNYTNDLESGDKYTKTITMIEKETGRKFKDIYDELVDQGLTVTEIAAKLELKTMSAISTHLYRLKREEERKTNNKLIVQGLSGQMPDVVERMFREQTGMEIKDFLKEKYIDEGLSLDDLADLLGMSARRLGDKVKNYGIYKTVSQSRQDAMKNGTLNYNEIHKKARLSRAKNFSRSSKQDMFRELIKHHAQNLLNEYRDIEIITGYNEYSILDTLEIDIPIIIFYKEKVIKLAIEYDGDYWHENRENDIEKDKLLKEKKWNLIRVEELGNKGNNLVLLETKAKNVINEIIKYITN